MLVRMSGGRDTQHVVIECSTNSKWVASSFLRNKKLRKESARCADGSWWEYGFGRVRLCCVPLRGCRRGCHARLSNPLLLRGIEDVLVLQHTKK